MITAIEPVGVYVLVLSCRPYKLLRYDGSVPPEPYFAQVQLTAWRAGWSKEDSMAQLALALEGPALQVLLDLTPAEQKDHETLTGAPFLMCGKDTHSAPHMHRRSWLSMHFCKPCFQRS